jgi:myosin heavy subunit
VFGRSSELTPHVYATSAAAFNGVLEENTNQSILVSGESGAGKTETVGREPSARPPARELLFHHHR